MFIVVSVNKCYATGAPLHACAYRAWKLSSLLTRPPAFRNQFRFLVAKARGSVVGVFCITGVSPDFLLPGRVQFQLSPLSDSCSIAIENYFNNLLLNDAFERRFKRIVGSSYLPVEELQQYNIEIPKLDCCSNSEMVLLQPNQIEVHPRPEF